MQWELVIFVNVPGATGIDQTNAEPSGGRGKQKKRRKHIDIGMVIVLIVKLHMTRKLKMSRHDDNGNATQAVEYARVMANI